MDIIKELAELQDKFYKECGDLYEAIEVLGKPLYDEMLKNYYDTYKKQYKLLSDKYDIDIKNQEHVIKLEYSELTPHRCGFLWLRKNEARKLNEREVAATNRMHFDSRWSDLDDIETKIYANDDEQDNEQPKKLPFLKRLFKRNKSEIATNDDVQSGTKPQELAAMESNSLNVNATPEDPSPSTMHAESPIQAADQNTDNTQNTGNVAEPVAPAQTSEAPKRGRKRKKITESTTDSPETNSTATQQLSGQIAIDELNNK